jgi:AAA family ATP:ADP antiporter
VYAFFVVNLLAFTLELDARVFFVWLSVFNLFVISVFWSFMSDIFDSRQAARLYGTIAAGGSCGAIAGPLIAALVPQTKILLMLSALLLAATVVCIRALARWAGAHPRAAEPPPEAPLGGSILAGARAALTSPFLLAICGYLLCYTALSTALYFQQVEIVRDAVPDPRERTRLFASVDLAVNGLTLCDPGARLLAARGVPRTGRHARRRTAALGRGFVWLGATPNADLAHRLRRHRRVGEFAISKPARETLFTVVPREERYKAKNFIDTVIYRGGDALAGWLFAGVSAFAAAAVAAAWTALAVFLGVRMKAWTGDDARSSPRLQRQR